VDLFSADRVGDLLAGMEDVLQRDDVDRPAIHRELHEDERVSHVIRELPTQIPFAATARHGHVDVLGDGVHCHVVDHDLRGAGAEPRGDLPLQVGQLEFLALAAGLPVVGVHGEDGSALPVADEEDAVGAEREGAHGANLRRAACEP